MDRAIRDYYSNRDEGARLRNEPHGILERVRTQELMERFLPAPPARVLDVGGATGVHAEWLARRGYEVHVVDPVESHVEAAGAIPGVSAAVGDARVLTETDDSQDAVLLLGPLYHLVDSADRHRALAEARRVACPRAPVFAAGISRHACVMDLGADGRLTAEIEPFLENVDATGQFRGGVVGFTTAYLHRPEELAAELAEAGLHGVEVFGIEGPAGPTLRVLGTDRLDEHLDATVRAARLVEQDPALIAASGHLLAVGTA
jgi:ubiquinone/menaquinone biosynthesis C-methylase UbiE